MKILDLHAFEWRLTKNKCIEIPKVQYHRSVEWFQVCVIIHRGWHGQVRLSRSVRLVQPQVMFVCRTLYHGNVQKVPSRALCLRVLSEAAEQRHVQGAERQALLSRLLREALRLIVYWQLLSVRVCEVYERVNGCQQKVMLNSDLLEIADCITPNSLE